MLMNPLMKEHVFSICLCPHKNSIWSHYHMKEKIITSSNYGLFRHSHHHFLIVASVLVLRSIRYMAHLIALHSFPILASRSLIYGAYRTIVSIISIVALIRCALLLTYPTTVHRLLYYIVLQSYQYGKMENYCAL